ncbi:MAG: hypothetical protein E7530_00005 [Ruminococcaceae bacterium]|nr:hypothetical protein [Oscillospiraceae bacterium]
MKKFSLIMALILVCTVLFASCSVNEPGKEETSTTETSTEKTAQSTTEVTKPLTPEQKKEVEQVEKLVYNLAMAKNRDEIKPCVIQYTDEYADYVLGGFPDDDYIVKAERLVEYKDAIVFNITVTCECDPEYIYSGIQLFSYTDDGQLLINLDDEIVEAFVKEFACEACGGKGYTEKKAETSGGYDEQIPCEVCDEVGFVFDKVTE